jgi:hypothetical protein
MRHLPSELVLHVLQLLFAVGPVVVVEEEDEEEEGEEELVLVMGKYPCRPPWWQRVAEGLLLPGWLHDGR